MAPKTDGDGDVVMGGASQESLLAAPVAGEGTTLPRAERPAGPSYKPLQGRFKVADRKYLQQFANLYFTRLQLMRPVLRERVQTEWLGRDDAPVFVDSIKQVEDKYTAVIGTLFKTVKERQDVVVEYARERGVESAPRDPEKSLASPDDTLVLEDDSGRVALVGDALPVGGLVTGMVIAVAGKTRRDGDFEVSALLTAGMAPQKPLRADRGNAVVAIASGLHLGDPSAPPLPAQLLQDFLAGHAGTPGEQASLQAPIVRLVLAGNSIKLDDNADVFGPQQRKANDHADDAVRQLDLFLTQVCASMDVEVMPGKYDPSDFSLPQQRIHPFALPLASHYDTLHLVTNPSEFELEGVHFLGTSGQTIDDICRYSQMDDPLDALAETLNWRHIAPTCPDTLGAFPFYDSDPFILSFTPHVYFVGNQRAFGTRVVNGVRLISVPSFRHTGTIVLVNLATLECQPVQFSGF